jgi:hypothetical protein
MIFTLPTFTSPDLFPWLEIVLGFHPRFAPRRYQRRTGKVAIERDTVLSHNNYSFHATCTSHDLLEGHPAIRCQGEAGECERPAQPEAGQRIATADIPGLHQRPAERIGPLRGAGTRAVADDAVEQIGPRRNLPVQEAGILAAGAVPATRFHPARRIGIADAQNQPSGGTRDGPREFGPNPVKRQLRGCQPGD